MPSVASAREVQGNRHVFQLYRALPALVPISASLEGTFGHASDRPQHSGSPCQRTRTG